MYYNFIVEFAFSAIFSYILQKCNSCTVHACTGKSVYTGSSFSVTVRLSITYCLKQKELATALFVVYAAGQHCKKIVKLKELRGLLGKSYLDPFLP